MLRYSDVMENVQAAKALLKRVGATDLSGYEEVRRMVGSSLGYVNFLTKLLYVDKAGMAEVRNIWRTLKSEPQVVSGFSRPAADLDTAEEFWDEYNRSRDRSLAKRALEELPSAQKAMVSLDRPEDTALLKALWQDADKGNFIKKVSRYKDRETLVRAMGGFVHDKTSNHFDEVLAKLEGLGLPVLHSDRDVGMIISLVMDWQKLRQVAADTSWCIVSSESTFRHYLSAPLSMQYVIFNFGGAPNFRKIGVTTNVRGYNTAHLVDDRHFSIRELTRFLDARGVDVKTLYPSKESIIAHGMDALRVQDLLNMFTKEEILARKRSYDINDFVFMADAGTDTKAIRSMARRLGIKITGPVSSMLKFYTPEEILGMKDSYDIDDLVSLSDAGVDKQRIRRKAMEFGIEIEGPVYRLLKFYSPYDLLEMKKEFTSQDFALLAKAGDRERIRSVVFDKGTRIVGPVGHMLGFFSPDEAVKMNDGFSVNDLVDLIDAKFDEPLRADVLEFVKNPKFAENSLAQLLRKRAASIMKWVRDIHGYENTGHQDVRDSPPAVTMVLRLMRDQNVRFEDSMDLLNNHLKSPVALVRALKSVHGELGAERIRHALNHGRFKDSSSVVYLLSELIADGVEEDTCAGMLEERVESDRFTPPEPPNLFKATAENLGKRTSLLDKFMAASRRYFSKELWLVGRIVGGMSQLEFLDYVGVRPQAKDVVDMLGFSGRRHLSEVEDYLGWFRRAGYDMQDPVFLGLVGNGRVDEDSGHGGLSAIFYCLEKGVSVRAAKDALRSIMDESSSPVTLRPGEFEKQIKKHVPEMAGDWAGFLKKNSVRVAEKAASALLEIPIAKPSEGGRVRAALMEEFLEVHLPRLKEAGFTLIEKMLGIGLLLCDIDPGLAEGLRWTGTRLLDPAFRDALAKAAGDFDLSAPVRQRLMDIRFPRRTLAEFVMGVFVNGVYRGMDVSDKTARATYEWLDGTFDWDAVGHSAWSVMLVPWRKYDRPKYLRYLRMAASVTGNSVVYHRGQERPRTNRVVLLKHLLYATAKDGSDADFREVADTVRFTSAEKRLSETRDLLMGYSISDFDLDYRAADRDSIKQVVAKLRRMLVGGSNESAGHVATTLGSFLAIRG